MAHQDHDVGLVVLGQEHPLQLLKPHLPGLGLQAVAGTRSLKLGWEEDGSKYLLRSLGS